MRAGRRPGSSPPVCHTASRLADTRADGASEARLLGASRRALLEELERSAPSSRCRPSPTSLPNGSNAGSDSITTSSSTSTITRYRISCCAKRFGHASPRAPSKSSTAVSWLLRTCAHRRTASIRRCASICRRVISAMPTGRRSACAGRPAPSAATPRHCSRSSCGSARILSKASEPASASYGSPRAMGVNGSKPPTAGRSRSGRAPTARSIRFSKNDIDRRRPVTPADGPAIAHDNIRAPTYFH